MLPNYAQVPHCDLCSSDGGVLLWQNAQLRVILFEDPHFPCFIRVVWHEHVREMTDLTIEQRQSLLDVVFLVETVMREVLKPTKINLASLGNMTPHLHWHVIPRFEGDLAFPASVWSLTAEQMAQPPQPKISPYVAQQFIDALKIELWAL